MPWRTFTLIGALVMVLVVFLTPTIAPELKPQLRDSVLGAPFVWPEIPGLGITPYVLQDFRGITEVKLGYVKKDEKGKRLPAGNIVIQLLC